MLVMTWKQWIASFGGTEIYKSKRDISLLGERSNELLGWRELPAKPIDGLDAPLYGRRSNFLTRPIASNLASKSTAIIELPKHSPPKKANTISF
jgi:hypothetical protein